MKILFAINSWHVAAQGGFHQVIRETWGKDVSPADLRFFIPRVKDYQLQSDEVFLDVSFDYEQICREVQEMLRWSVQQGYDYTLMASTDSFLLPQKVLNCGFEKYDYAGDFAFNDSVPFGERNPEPVNCTFMTKEGYGISRKLYNWCGTGPVRILSKKAAAIIAERTADAEFWHAADDIMIGQALAEFIKTGEIIPWRIPNYGGIITWHYKNTEREAYRANNGWMKRMYEAHKND
jgi:hypothetical protein